MLCTFLEDGEILDLHPLQIGIRIDAVKMCFGMREDVIEHPTSGTSFVSSDLHPVDLETFEMIQVVSPFPNAVGGEVMLEEFSHCNWG